MYGKAVAPIAILQHTSGGIASYTVSMWSSASLGVKRLPHTTAYKRNALSAVKQDCEPIGEFFTRENQGNAVLERWNNHTRSVVVSIR